MTHRPAGTYHPIQPTDLTVDQLRRTHQLEQRPQAPPVDRPCTINANSAGGISGGTTTGRHFPWRSAFDLQYLIIDADGVGDEGLTVEIYRDDTPVITVTITSDGVTREGHDLRWSPGQPLRIEVADGVVGILHVQLHGLGLDDGALIFPTDGGDPEG